MSEGDTPTLRDFIGSAISDVVGALNDFEEKSREEGWNSSGFPNLNQNLDEVSNSDGTIKQHQLSKTEYLLSAKYDQKTGKKVVSTVINFDFDIAVTATSETKGGKKAGIKVLEVVEAGGNKEHINKNDTISRIRVKLPIALNPVEYM